MIRKIRPQFTISQVARMAGVTRQTIGAIENEQYAPSALLAFVLAHQLGKEVNELFYLEES